MIDDRGVLAVALFEDLDSIVDDRVLVPGTLPPEGRDLDLVVRPDERDVIVGHLVANGFVARGGDMRPARVWAEQWVRFLDGTAFPIDINPARRWGLPDAELTALFAESTLIERMKHMARPAPHHVLLIVGRRFLASGHLSVKQRSRIEQALEADGGAWEVAARRAHHWGLVLGLKLLREADSSGSVPTARHRLQARKEVYLSADSAWKGELLVRRARAARPARSRVVSFSGLDGSGKSSQVSALQATLEMLGTAHVVEWKALGHNASVRLVRRSVKRVLNLFLSESRGGGSTAVQGESLVAGPEPSLLRHQNSLLTHLWSTVVAVASASHFRVVAMRHRWGGKVVIFDRYALDTTAQLRYFYGDTRNFGFQRWLVRTVCTTPHCSYLLDVAPEIAFARKPEQYVLEQLRQQADLLRSEGKRLNVLRLDGERRREDLSTQIASEIWAAFANRPGEGAMAVSQLQT